MSSCVSTSQWQVVSGCSDHLTCVVMSDLKKYGLLTDWREVAQDRVAWRGVPKMTTGRLNDQVKASKKERKD